MDYFIELCVKVGIWIIIFMCIMKTLEVSYDD